MNRRTIPLMLMLLMLLSVPVYAAESRAAQVVPSISFSGTSATYSVIVVADKSTDDVDATIKAWVDGKCVRIWKRNAVGHLVFSEKIATSKGSRYKLTADISLNGSALPRFSTEKTCP